MLSLELTWCEEETGNGETKMVFISNTVWNLVDTLLGLSLFLLEVDVYGYFLCVTSSVGGAGTRGRVAAIKEWQKTTLVCVCVH